MNYVNLFGSTSGLLHYFLQHFGNYAVLCERSTEVSGFITDSEFLLQLNGCPHINNNSTPQYCIIGTVINHPLLTLKNI